MERRQFIGATAAVWLGTMMPTAANGSPVAMPVDLNWRSDVIKTIAHNRAERMPVVTGVSMKMDGSELAIVGDDHYVGIYDMVSQTYTHEIDAHHDWVRSAVYSPNGKQLATAGNDRALRVWRNGNYESALFTRNHGDAIVKLAYSPDSTKLAVVGFEKTMRIYDAQTGRVIQKLACPCPDNHSVAFSVDGGMVAAAGRCGTVRVWDVGTGTLATQVKAHRRRIRSLQFTSDGQLVSVSDDQLVKVIDPKLGRVVSALPRQPSKLFAAKLLPGKKLATGGSDNQIRIWDLETQQEVGMLRGHTGTVSCLDSRNGMLVSGSYDTQVRLWQVPTEKQSLERRANHQWRPLK